MNCPRCREGKLEERLSSKSKPDTMMSIALGAALEMGYFPAYKSVRVTEYNCNKCGYQEIKEGD